jgi:hypothetical protein
MLKLRSMAVALSAVLFGAQFISSAPLAQDVLPTQQVTQSTMPADDNIRVVVADLDRHEKELDRYKKPLFGCHHIERWAIRNRTQLEQTERRLNSSPNKSHASWAEASERLQALKGYVQDTCK